MTGHSTLTSYTAMLSFRNIDHPPTLWMLWGITRREQPVLEHLRSKAFLRKRSGDQRIIVLVSERCDCKYDCLCSMRQTCDSLVSTRTRVPLQSVRHVIFPVEDKSWWSEGPNPNPR